MNYPKIGKLFELTLDGQTKKFKLVKTCFCNNLEEIRKKLRIYYEIPHEGKWLQAFIDKYSADGDGPVGIATNYWDSEHKYLGDAHYHFYVDVLGKKVYMSTDDIQPFTRAWRWLIIPRVKLDKNTKPDNPLYTS